MKNTSFFLIIFLLLYNFQVKAETTIGYVDMQLVMNKSEPGIFIKKKIDNLNIKSEKNFSARAEILKKQEVIAR